MRFSFDTATGAGREIKHLLRTHRIDEASLLIILGVGKPDLKSMSAEAIWEQLKAYMAKRHAAHANKSLPTIHGLLGIEQVPFDIEVGGRLISYRPAFQGTFTRGDESLSIDSVKIIARSYPDLDYLTKHLVAAITGKWNRKMSTLDIEAILQEFAAAIRRQISQ